MNGEIDLDAFRVPPTGNGPPHKAFQKKPPRHRRGQKFLKGPIPWDWLRRAMVLPGKSLHVALILWKEAGIKKQRTVKLNLSALKELGIPRSTARRGLDALEVAGLVSVSHSAGRCLQVTLNDHVSPALDESVDCDLR